MRYVHAGLGETDRVDVEVRWPHEGGVERLREVDANQTLLITWRSGGSTVRQGWMPGAGT